MQGTIIFGLIFAIIIAIFAIQNASIVALNVLMWKFEISLAVVVLGSIIFGALVIGIFSYIKQFQLRRKNKNLKLEIQSLKEELDKTKDEKRKMEYLNQEKQLSEEKEKAEKIEADKKEIDKKEEKRGFFSRKKKEPKDKDIAYNLEEENDDDKNSN